MFNIATCEVCGQQFVAGYGYSIACCWLVTGSAFVESHMCAAPGGQHWGCTPQHAMQALETCLREHMSVDNLMQKHAEAHALKDENGTVTGYKPRYSPLDQWAANRGDNFHFLTFKLPEGS